MYMNTAYLKDLLVSPRTPADREDTSAPLVVTCCGLYRMKTMKRLDTTRPAGRRDYQLLYFHSGKGRFFFDGDEGPETIIHPGQMVFFHPGDPQIYHYTAQDKTEVFWVHFTGNDVASFIRKFDLPEKTGVINTGVHSIYQDIFLEMIRELQLYKNGFEEMLVLNLKRLLLLTKRTMAEPAATTTAMEDVISEAVAYFGENYATDIVVKDYAKDHFVTTSWFINSFKAYTGRTPRDYITSLRITNAFTLLANGGYSVKEIASLVGYDDPLYFSRVFKKSTGYTPGEYRKAVRGE